MAGAGSFLQEYQKNYFFRVSDYVLQLLSFSPKNFRKRRSHSSNPNYTQAHLSFKINSMNIYNPNSIKLSSKEIVTKSTIYTKNCIIERIVQNKASGRIEMLKNYEKEMSSTWLAAVQACTSIHTIHFLGISNEIGF